MNELEKLAESAKREIDNVLSPSLSLEETLYVLQDIKDFLEVYIESIENDIERERERMVE